MTYGVQGRRQERPGGARPASEPEHRSRVAPSIEGARVARAARQGALEHDALSKGHNLLGPDAGDEKVGGAYDVQLAAAQLQVGDTISTSIETKGSVALDAWEMAIRFLNAGGATIETASGSSFAGTAYAQQSVHGVKIPAGTATVRVLCVAIGAVAGTVMTRRAMLNRGPRALPFEEPPFRPARETLDVVQDGNTWRKVAGVDENNRITGASVAPGAIGPGEIAAHLAVPEILAELPDSTAPDAPLLVLLTTDRKLYRWTDGEPPTYTRTVGPGDLEVDTVTAGTVAAGAIAARELAIAQLSEISGALGIILRGLLTNAAATRAIRLDQEDAVPGSVTELIDLDPVNDDDPVLLLAGGKLLVTKAAALRLQGHASLEQLEVPSSGSATLNGPALVRALLQSSPAGSALGAGQRAELRDGSLVVRQQTDGTENTQAVLGTFSRSTGGLTDRSASGWVPTDADVFTNQRNVVVQHTGPEISLLANLPAYDGLYRFSGSVTAEVHIEGSGFGVVEARVRCYATVDGGAEQDLGIIGWAYCYAGEGFRTQPFNGVIAADVAVSLAIRLAIEVLVVDSGTGLSRSSGTASVSALSDVEWKENVSGTVVTRRGLFLGAEPGKPQISPEGLDADPLVADLVEGETWYNRTDHKWKYFDGTAIVVM